LAISEDRRLAENGRPGITETRLPARGVASDLSQQGLSLALAAFLAVETAVFVAAAASDKIPSFVLTLFRALLTL
jgi:hypothetical protein